MPTRSVPPAVPLTSESRAGQSITGHTQSPPVRPFLKLKSVSMRQGPPDQMMGREALGGLTKLPGTPHSGTTSGGQGHAQHALSASQSAMSQAAMYQAAISSAAVSPAATSPAATSPAATSPAATSPAATSPAATSPAATSPAAPGDDLRPTFTAWQTPRPTDRVREETVSATGLPRTHRRFGGATAEPPGPPPIPAVAVRLREKRSAHPSQAGGALTPFQRLDQALRQRLWDPLSALPSWRPPSSG